MSMSTEPKRDNERHNFYRSMMGATKLSRTARLVIDKTTVDLLYKADDRPSATDEKNFHENVSNARSYLDTAMLHLPKKSADLNDEEKKMLENTFKVKAPIDDTALEEIQKTLASTVAGAYAKLIEIQLYDDPAIRDGKTSNPEYLRVHGSAEPADPKQPKDVTLFDLSKKMAFDSTQGAEAVIALIAMNRADAEIHENMGIRGINLCHMGTGTPSYTSEDTGDRLNDALAYGSFCKQYHAYVLEKETVNKDLEGGKDDGSVHHEKETDTVLNGEKDGNHIQVEKEAEKVVVRDKDSLLSQHEKVTGHSLTLDDVTPEPHDEATLPDHIKTFKEALLEGRNQIFNSEEGESYDKEKFAKNAVESLHAAVDDKHHLESKDFKIFQEQLSGLYDMAHEVNHHDEDNYTTTVKVIVEEVSRLRSRTAVR